MKTLKQEAKNNEKYKNLGNNISDAFKSVFRNAALSVASISCITITLILVAISILLSVNVNSFTSDIEKDLTIVVFIDRNVDEEALSSIEASIQKLGYVEKIEHQTKEQIKIDMQQESEVFNTIMSEWSEENNPLQDTLLVSVNDVDYIGEVANTIKEIEGVSVVKYGEGMVEELVSIFDVVKNITYIVVIGLIVVTGFLISNTIKITISSRRKQIDIMRLVGASNTYIKSPFFIEGIILGFLGSIIP
ncbi:MAG: permease-like cell division protein FtsX, partial [Bacilli bacterium]|nr:permease-like cell division protein FtsX [Bacilli bacterium]